MDNYSSLVDVDLVQDLSAYVHSLSSAPPASFGTKLHKENLPRMWSQCGCVQLDSPNTWFEGQQCMSTCCNNKHPMKPSSQ